MLTKMDRSLCHRCRHRSSIHLPLVPLAFGADLTVQTTTARLPTYQHHLAFVSPARIRGLLQEKRHRSWYQWRPTAGCPVQIQNNEKRKGFWDRLFFSMMVSRFSEPGLGPGFASCHPSDTEFGLHVWELMLVKSTTTKNATH